MPQFIPFHFLNQVSFAYFSLLVIIYVFSKWILPNFPLLALARMVTLNPHKKFNSPPPVASFSSFPTTRPPGGPRPKGLKGPWRSGVGPRPWRRTSSPRRQDPGGVRWRAPRGPCPYVTTWSLTPCRDPTAPGSLWGAEWLFNAYSD